MHLLIIVKGKDTVFKDFFFNQGKIQDQCYAPNSIVLLYLGVPEI